MDCLIGNQIKHLENLSELQVNTDKQLSQILKTIQEQNAKFNKDKNQKRTKQ